jgi:hypothetical protein
MKSRKTASSWAVAFALVAVVGGACKVPAAPVVSKAGVLAMPVQVAVKGAKVVPMSVGAPGVVNLVNEVVSNV